MAPVFKTSSRVAWSLERQGEFGAPLEAADLTRFIRLSDPLKITEDVEHWSDRGTVGAGHEWETQRGRERKHVSFELPVQPLPVDFIGYLMALFFSGVGTSQNGSGAWEHESGFVSLDTRPEAWVTGLAVREDGVDYLLQDIACTSLKLQGNGNSRLEAGGSFVASRITGELAGFTWPGSTALRYLYNYAGTFSIAGDPTRRAQLKSFELSMENGIDRELAWRKAADESGRIYPACWPYTPERSMKLGMELIAGQGDLAVFRQARRDGTRSEIVLSCLGDEISGTSPADNDEVVITVPRAFYTGLDYSYGDGLLEVSLDAEGAWDETIGGPLEVRTVQGLVSQYFPGA